MKQTRFHGQFTTLPNLLSYLRLALIPLIIWLYCGEKNYTAAAWVMACSGATDIADGWIARHYRLITDWGKIVDPIADKLTQFSLTLCLSIKYPVLQFVLVLFVIKEGFQCLAGLTSLRRGKILPGALMAGKVCTTVLFLSLILLVLLPDLNPNIVNMFAAIDTAFLLFSFISYIFAYYGKNAKIQDF